MDPNVTLENIRRIVRQIENAQDDSGHYDGIVDLASILAADVADLDEWLSKGGFRPSDWS